MRRVKPRTRRRLLSDSRTPRRFPRLSKAALWRGGVALLWITTISTVAYGLHRLEPHARSSFSGHPARLHWVDLPAWLADPAQRAVLADIERGADLFPDDDPHAPDLCARVYAGLDRSPWVRKVERVSKQPDGIVHVRAVFRKPLAMVVAKGIAYLVDETGTRLPGVMKADFIRREDGLALTGVRAPVPPVGAIWRGRDLAAGLKLVQFLNRAAASGRLACRPYLQTVDVAEFRPGGGPLRIKTIYPGSYVYWGLPPGEEFDIESTAERKLAMLATLNPRGGEFPNAERIDVRDPDRILIHGRR